MLAASGNRIIDTRTGQPVTLRGVHLYWFSHSNPPSLSRSNQEIRYVDTIFRRPDEGGWGARMATIFVNTDVAGRIDTFGNVITNGNSVWRGHMDALVSVAEQRDGVIMFSWAFDDPFGTHNQLIGPEGRSALRWLARRYSGNRHVLFAVQSEPPGNQSATDMRSACEQTIDEIRDEFPDVLIGIPGSNWSQVTDWIAIDPPLRPNLFVKPHVYSGRLDGTTIEATLERHTWPRFEEGWPIVIGEMGWGARSNDLDIEILVETAEAQGWGYQGWALTHSGSPEMLNSASINDLTPWGSLMSELLVQSFQETAPVPALGAGLLGGLTLLGAASGVLLLRRRR